jgi:hypothetical protein
MHRFTHLFVILALACPGFAQNPQPVAKSTMRMSPRMFPGPVVTGVPYSAQRVSEHVQVAGDGTRFTSSNRQETVYRDSQGRTRTERPIMMGPNAPDSPLIIEINDPVANVGYTLDAQNKVAHRFTFSSPAARLSGGGQGGGAPMPNAILGAPANRTVFTTLQTAPAITTGVISAVPPGASANARPEMSQEELGPQMIEGVMAKGHRMTQTWATGTQGNDRPFQAVFETWTSIDLQVMVLSKNSDPRSGENTTKLTNISRAEPDASLFAPPPDYTVVDETGTFEMQWTSSPRQ